MTESIPSILLVDDDRDICENMADIIADLVYEVDVAHEGGAALDLVRKRRYEVALLDLKMHGMDGLTPYREIKKFQSGTAAFLITAYGRRSARARRAGPGTSAGPVIDPGGARRSRP